MSFDTDEPRAKKERSPSFPFISLPRALDRAQAFFDAHRKEPTRISAVASTWNYSQSSSGLQQTVAALKQFGLLDELRGEGERRIQISDLARTILTDQRPGARERGIDEAALRPRLLEEYAKKWVPERPSDGHCLSELELDKGFNAPAAKLFLKVFDETVAYAGIGEGDKTADGDLGSDALDPGGDTDIRNEVGGRGFVKPPPPTSKAKNTPLSDRLQVVTTGNQLSISAALFSGKEVDKLIRILEANKMLLDDTDDEVDVSQDQESSPA